MLLTIIHTPGSIVKFSIYSIARAFILAITAYLLYAGRVDDTLWVWVALSIIVLYTYVGDWRDRQKNRCIVTNPKQLFMADGFDYYLGVQQEYLNYFGGWDIDAETVNMAAMRSDDGLIIAVRQPGDFKELVNALYNQKLMRKGSQLRSWTHGYITSEGNFVSVAKAVKVARLSGQLPLSDDRKSLESITHLYPNNRKQPSETMAVAS